MRAPTCLLLAFAGKSATGQARTGCSCNGCIAASRCCQSGVLMSCCQRRGIMLLFLSEHLPAGICVLSDAFFPFSACS